MPNTRLPEFGLVLPEQFVEIPLSGDEDTRSEIIYEMVRDTFGPDEGESDRFLHTLAFWVGVTEAVDEQGAHLAALMPVPRQDGQGFDTITLVMTLVETTLVTPDVAIEGLLALLRSRLPHADVRPIDLPCGPAAAAVELGAYQFPPELHPDGIAVEMPQGRFQVHIPLPGQAWTAIFEMTTTALDDWDDCCVLMAAIMRTVGFGELEYDEQGVELVPEPPTKTDIGSALTKS
ncbi:hypothetical protein [Embleya sp. AB8]|uniref:hypothetical protein n=1 Tax=Embleya sp. AB8 TaxID=3156304 RepID=UPI003C7899F5